MQVIVIGGGIAGLTAALRLSEQGISTLLLEADPLKAGGRFAGRSTTALSGSVTQGSNHEETTWEQTWEFPGEHGIHGVWSQYHNFKALIKPYVAENTLVPVDGQEWIQRDAGRIRHVEIGRIVRRTWWPAPFHHASLLFRPSFLSLLQPMDLIAIPEVGGTILM